MVQQMGERLSIVASALADDPRLAPRAARLAGFRGVLFDAWSASLSIPDLSDSGRRELRRLVSAEDQQLVGLRTGIGPKGFGPGADVDQAITRLNCAMQAAAGLAAPLLCVDLGPLPRPARPVKSKPAISLQQAGIIIIPTAPPTASTPQEQAAPPPPPDPAFVAQVNAALTELGSRADRYGVSVAFSSALASFAALHEAIASARCPWFGVDLDPAAVLRDEWSMDEIFSTIGPLIRHVRAKDATLGDDRRTQPAVIGRGNVDWPGLLSAVDDAGYAGFITIDPMELPDRPAGAIAGAKYLRSLPSR